MVVQRRTGRLKRQRIDEYTDEHRKFLRDGGIAWVTQVPGFGRPGTVNAAIGVRDADIDAVREAWSILGAEVTAEFIAENPGRRGYWWWVFDAPEPRRRQLAGGVLYVDRHDTPKASRKFSFGIPCVWAGVSEPVVFETEAAYLARHDLLTVDERIALGDDYPQTETHFEWAGMDRPNLNHKEQN